MKKTCKFKTNINEKIEDIIKDGFRSATLTIRLNKHASIKLNVSELSFDDQDQSNEEDFSKINPVSSIFSNNINETEEILERTPVDRLAARKAPSSKTERQYSIKTPEEINEDNSFVDNHPHLKDKGLKEFISNINEFFEAVELNRHKKSEINPDSITNIREKAVAMEAKEIQESIGVPTWIVNEKYGSLMINDLGVNLPLNNPLNLSRFSARKLYESLDLKYMLSNNMVRFVSPEEAADIMSKTLKNQEDSSVPIFDNKETAEKAMSVEKLVDNESDVLDLNEDIGDNSTEEDRLIKQTSVGNITNLTQKGVRKSVHGTNILSQKPSSFAIKSPNNAATKNKPIVKKF